MDPVQQTFGGQGGGLSLLSKEVTVTKRNGAGVLGQVCVFDFSNTDAAVNNNTAGLADSGTRNVRVQATADVNIGVPAVLKAAVADDGDVKSVVLGPANALVTTAGAAAVGAPLYLSNTGIGFTDASPAVGAKVVAILNEAQGSGITNVLTPVIVGHFGAAAAAAS